MSISRMALAVCAMAFVLVGAAVVSTRLNAQSQIGEDEKKVWSIEHDYWRYVQENNLTAYRDLWHQDFVGWPYMSSDPVHKAHITDWITSQTDKGFKFKMIELRPAAIQITGMNAMTYYWVTDKWVAKDGSGVEITSRITHTWVKIGNDWKILGGMSSVETAAPKR